MKPEPDAWMAKEKFDTGHYQSSFETIFSQKKPESESLTERGDVIYKDVEPLWSAETITGEIRDQITAWREYKEELKEKMEEAEREEDYRRLELKLREAKGAFNALIELEEVFDQ